MLYRAPVLRSSPVAPTAAVTQRPITMGPGSQGARCRHQALSHSAGKEPLARSWLDHCELTAADKITIRSTSFFMNVVNKWLVSICINLELSSLATLQSSYQSTHGSDVRLTVSPKCRKLVTSRYASDGSVCQSSLIQPDDGMACRFRVRKATQKSHLPETGIPTVLCGPG
jgi:hypothetical protein